VKQGLDDCKKKGGDWVGRKRKQRVLTVLQPNCNSKPTKERKRRNLFSDWLDLKKVNYAGGAVVSSENTPKKKDLVTVL